MKAIRIRAFLWVLLAIVVAVICMMQFINRSPLQTNLLALLPSTERNQIAENAVTRLTEIAGNRAIFLIGNSSPDGAAQAARSFTANLREASVFSKVITEIPPIDPKKLIDIYFKYRFSLLSDDDRALMISGKINLKERIQNKLYSPFHFGLTLSSVDDPFAFTDNWIASLPFKNTKLDLENGLLVTHSADKTWVFISAELLGSAYDNKTQRQVIDKVANAEAALRQAYPNTELLRTGTVFYAESARSSAEHEVDLIGSGSLIGMLVLLYFVFRSLRPLALGLLSVAFGITTAVAITILTFGEIHLITLVFGASLIGEAIDYAIQYFAAHLGAGKNWKPMVGLRRIAPGLTVALTTSLLGYGALTLAPFPALKQIGLFALVGLSSAWLSVFLLLPALLAIPNERNPETAIAGPRRLLKWWELHIGKRECHSVILLLLVISITGWLKLYGDDDVHLLISRPYALASQEEKIRELSGISNNSQFFLIEGPTTEAVLTNEERLTERLATLTLKGKISGYQGISTFVPSEARQIKNHTLLYEKVFHDEKALSEELANTELRDEIGKQQIADFKASSLHPLMLKDWLQSPLSSSFRNLWIGPTSDGYAAIGLPQGITDIASLSKATANLQGVTLVDKAGSTSRLLHKYRQWGAVWLLGVIFLVYCVLAFRYKAQQATIILTPTILAIMLTFGIFGHLHIPLSLFNLMGLMLVLGVGVNYSIFLREGGTHAASALSGVLLSAGTTLLSFGLLAFSSMPALSSFGLTLLIGIGIAVLLAPMVLTFNSKVDTYA